ncbi:GatB/YqeY domain-containing protein [Luteococcus sp. Sow4_B9]|uniref:GatB/YqeY domain-containing protein n=1 Tax=Luteococcus sp. Sow4_B9 TaxID=3438792 RepID=UPI003F9A3D7E
MGALKYQLKADLVVAMKARDEAAKSNIRMALTAIHTEEVAGAAARELTDAEEIGVVTKEVNKRKDSAEAYAQGGRPELAAKETCEAEFLARYLPEAMDEEELRAIVAEEIAAASGPNGEKPTMRQMGQVMKAVSNRTQGRADGKTVSGLVKAAMA